MEPPKVSVPEATLTVMPDEPTAPLRMTGEPTEALVERPASSASLPFRLKLPVEPGPNTSLLKRSSPFVAFWTIVPEPLMTTPPVIVLAAPSTREPPLTTRPPPMVWAEEKVSVPALTTTPPVKLLPVLAKVAWAAPFLTMPVAPMMPFEPLKV